MATTKKNAAGQKGQLAKTVTKAAGGQGSSTPSAPHWAQRGWKFAAEEMRRREIQQEEISKGVRRFWIKDGSDTMITFIDDEPFMIREHNFQINGKWGNYKTCMLGADDQGCVFCEADNKPRFVAMFSVIDHTEYTSKDGKPMKNQIRLFAAGADTLKMLDKLREKNGGSLAGCVFEVSRTGDKSPGVGNMFQFVKRVNLRDPKVYKSYGFTAPPKPIDYDTVLRPMSREDAETWLGRSAAEDSARREEVEY